MAIKEANNIPVLLKNKNLSSICIINVPSLLNSANLNKFQSFVAALNFQPDVNAINETWEKPFCMGQHKNLSGYGYISNPRVVNKGGGEVMYIKSNINYQMCNDLTIMNEKHFEYLFMNLKFDHCEVTFGTILYRSPNQSSNSFSVFLSNLTNALCK